MFTSQERGPRWRAASRNPAAKPDVFSIRQPYVNRRACPAGCPLDHHECGSGDDVVEPHRGACTGWCWTLTVDALLYWGATNEFGCCPCQVRTFITRPEPRST
jgi:hypothetical protein